MMILHKTRSKAKPEGKIVLGKKLKNAYSVENMRKAYETFKTKISKINFEWGK